MSAIHLNFPQGLVEWCYEEPCIYEILFKPGWLLTPAMWLHVSEGARGLGGGGGGGLRVMPGAMSGCPGRVAALSPLTFIHP